MIAVTNHPFCICPLDHFGPRCYLRFQACNFHPCSNNGTCLYTNESYDNYRVDCFQHDTQIDHCSQCFSDGKCVRNDNNFICLCSRCNQGDRCEFNMEAFGFTLDSLLVNESKIVKIIYLSIMFVLFFIGLFNNFCSFVTFIRPVPRKFGVGNYLFLITCLNQLSLCVY